jgi:hypothetical protein
MGAGYIDAMGLRGLYAGSDTRVVVDGDQCRDGRLALDVDVGAGSVEIRREPAPRKPQGTLVEAAPVTRRA